MTILKGMTWNHTRGFLPVVAAAQRYEELTGEVSIAWNKRSLQNFADQPIDHLAEEYDLIVIDHPWIGFAAQKNHFIPLDEVIPGEAISDHRANSVGPSFDSYVFDGRLWALPLDAASPVASCRTDVLRSHNRPVPETWSDLMELGNSGDRTRAQHSTGHSDELLHAVFHPWRGSVFLGRWSGREP